jgi:hypothetical protein
VGSFVFPYATAHQALVAMEDLASRLRSVVSAHNDALTIAHEDFTGETREQFDRDFGLAMDSLLAYASNLDVEADELRSTIARAHYVEALMATSTP